MRWNCPRPMTQHWRRRALRRRQSWRGCAAHFRMPINSRERLDFGCRGFQMTLAERGILRNGDEHERKERIER